VNHYCQKIVGARCTGFKNSPLRAVPDLDLVNPQFNHKATLIARNAMSANQRVHPEIAVEESLKAGLRGRTNENMRTQNKG